MSMQGLSRDRYRDGSYLAEVPDWHAGDGPWKAEKVLAMLRRNRIAPSSVCDVGCGAGVVLTHLQGSLPPGTQLVGYDVSPQAIALCRPKANERLRFRWGDFIEDSHERFDLVLVLDVFEHVSDYLGFLAALRPRGRHFVFHIPLDISAQVVAQRSEYMLHMRHKYGHLHHFTAPTALGTLAGCGYRVVDVAYTWDGELSPTPPLAWHLRHPLGAVVRAVEGWVFRWRPSLLAAWRPYYNLLVLAEGGAS